MSAIVEPMTNTEDRMGTPADQAGTQKHRGTQGRTSGSMTSGDVVWLVLILGSGGVAIVASILDVFV